jgi:hypothetical protein
MHVSVVLVAFSAKVSAKGLQKRILNMLSEKEYLELDYSLFSLSQQKIFEEYLKVENADTL